MNEETEMFSNPKSNPQNYGFSIRFKTGNSQLFRHVCNLDITT